MQWILQDFEDTRNLAGALKRAGAEYSFHKVVPFVGTLSPEPEIADPNAVVLFGSYTLWRYAETHGLRPGVFRIAPYVDEPRWALFTLNGTQARFAKVDELPALLRGDRRDWFIRPVADSKEIAGKVLPASEIIEIAQKVCALDPAEIPLGSLRPETRMLLAPPARIQKEWRVWVVEDQVVTWSLYREGQRVVYRYEIDADALALSERLIAANPGYAPAYVMDVCRTESGLKLLETNCVNAAGFYASDLNRLVRAITQLTPAAKGTT